MADPHSGWTSAIARKRRRQKGAKHANASMRAQGRELGAEGLAAIRRNRELRKRQENMPRTASSPLHGV